MPSVYPVRDVQERILACQELQAYGGRPYPPFVLVTAFRFSAPPDQNAIRSALQALIRRHTVMRVRFVRQRLASEYLREAQLRERCGAGPTFGGLYEQRIRRLDSLESQIPEVGSPKGFDRVAEVLGAAVRTPFDFAHPPALRVALLASSTGGHLLVLVISHLVADLWSLDVIEREFVQLYHGFAGDSPASLPRIGVDHLEFTLRERERLAGGFYETALAFWAAKWSVFGPLQLRHDEVECSPPVGAEEAGDTSAVVEAVVDDQDAVAIRTACVAMRLTPYLFFRVAICVALHLRTGRDRLAVCGNFANREHATRFAVGWFNNRQLIWSQLSSSTTWQDLSRNARLELVQAMRHQALPLHAVWHALGRSWEADDNHVGATIDFHSLRSTAVAGIVEVDRHFPRPWASRWTGVDLDIRVWELGLSYKIVVTYNLRRYRMPTMNALLRAIVACTTEFAARPSAPVCGVDL